MSLRFNCALAADIVLFGFSHEEKLAVLLIERLNDPFKNTWALPGGFIDNNEKVINAAYREMKEETGLKLNKLSQIGVYGGPKRDPRGRVVSVAYYGLISRDNLKIVAGDDAKSAKWFAIGQLPKLAFDHDCIIKDGLMKLKRKLGTHRSGIPLNGIESNSKEMSELQMMF